jgi:hypothetical protein
MKRLLVDYSLIGHGRKFALTLLKAEREGVEVGSRVEVVGDSVPPRIAEVTAVSPDEKVFEFASPSEQPGCESPLSLPPSSVPPGSRPGRPPGYRRRSR